MFKYIHKRQYDSINYQTVYPLIKANECLLQRMELARINDVHRGCVNTVVWDTKGELLLSGSDDQHLVISDPWRGLTKSRIHTAHKANIFSAKFLPHSNNSKIISCSGDGTIIYTDVLRQEETHSNKFTCHNNTCYDIVTFQDDPNTFLSCGEDGTVRYFDLRHKTKCTATNCNEDVLLFMGQQRAVTAIAVNPILSYHLAVATRDSIIRIYDQRMLGTRASDSYVEEKHKGLLMKLQPAGLDGKNHRVTSLRYSSRANQVLASYSSDYLYLFDIENFKEVPLETKTSAPDSSDEPDSDGGPTLKRLRLRGDWSDTGPQALPESERRTGDVAQARPTLQTTLMQRMTDVLSRMLHSGTGDRTENPTPADEQNVLPQSSNDDPTSSDMVPVSEASDLPSTSQSIPPNEPLDSSEPVHSDLPLLPDQSFNPMSHETSSPVNVLSTVVPMESSSPATESQEEEVKSKHIIESNVNISEDSTTATPGTSQSHTSPTVNRTEESSTSNTDDSTFVGLNDALSNLREQFVDKHKVQPSINLSYSEEGVTSSTISLGVADEVSRQFESQEDTSVPQSSQLDTPTESVNCDIKNVALPSSLCKDETASCSQTEQSSSTEPVSEASNLPISEGRKSQQLGRGNSSPARIGPPPADDDDDNDDDETEPPQQRPKNSRCRLAHAIGRAVQKVREEEENKHVEDPPDRTIPQGTVIQKYSGHRNARTMIKEACFWGESHVMSGSDCGRVFVWDRVTGKLVMLWEADRHVVNCLQPHPSLPILATSGIDYDIKLWAPLCQEPRFDEDKAAEIMRRNEALLEETRDTITVPATFMIRMLASLNHIRRGRNRAREENPSEQEEEEEEDDEDDDDEE